MDQWLPSFAFAFALVVEAEVAEMVEVAEVIEVAAVFEAAGVVEVPLVLDAVVGLEFQMA